MDLPALIAAYVVENNYRHKKVRIEVVFKEPEMEDKQLNNKLRFYEVYEHIMVLGSKDERFWDTCKFANISSEWNTLM